MKSSQFALPAKTLQVTASGIGWHYLVTMVGMSPYQIPSLIFCEFRKLAKPTKLIDIAQYIINLIYAGSY